MFLTYPAYFLAVDADDHANQLAPALVTLTNFQTHGDEATLAQFQTLSRVVFRGTATVLR
jgi:hypothetical protein